MSNILSIGIALVLLASSLDALAGHAVTTWRENKAGALSVAMDDGLDIQTTIAIPAMNERGLKGTFSICTDLLNNPSPPVGAGPTASWEDWRSAAAGGHEIGSHSRTHADLTNPGTDLVGEIVGSKISLLSNIPTNEAASFTYPWGYLNATVESITAANYLSGRGCCYCNYINPASEPAFYDLVACCAGGGAEGRYDLEGMKWLADKTVSLGGWMIPLWHGFNTSGFDPWPAADFYAFLDFIQTKSLWIAPVRDVVKYIQERDRSTLAVVSSASDRIVLNLTDTLDDSIFFEPLTIRSEVPAGWTTIKVEQGSLTKTVTPTVEGTALVIYYEAVPDRGPIILTSVSKVSLASVSADPKNVAGGDSFTVKINLSGPAPADLTISLWSSSPLATMVGTITVPSGSTTAITTGTTKGVSKVETVTIFASDGTINRSYSINVKKK